MGSGPRTGLAEIHIPDLQPGSSIMPGKVNPVVAEAVHQVVAQVMGNDAAVAFAGALGNFELNVMLPVIARNLLESIRLLAAVSRGVRGPLHRTASRPMSSAASATPLRLRRSATALNPFIGYEAAAQVVKQAQKEGRTIRDSSWTRSCSPRPRRMPRSTSWR